MVHGDRSLIDGNRLMTRHDLREARDGQSLNVSVNVCYGKDTGSVVGSGCVMVETRGSVVMVEARVA
jgi:hypothetical protein